MTALTSSSSQSSRPQASAWLAARPVWQARSAPCSTSAAQPGVGVFGAVLAAGVGAVILAAAMVVSEGRLTLVAACTPAIDHYSSHADALAPRWLYWRLPNRDAAAKTATGRKPASLACSRLIAARSPTWPPES
ncbi:MAG: hypothetical protein ACRDYA_20855 [Egibacteraceae bacterium]